MTLRSIIAFGCILLLGVSTAMEAGYRAERAAGSQAKFEAACDTPVLALMRGVQRDGVPEPRWRVPGFGDAIGPLYRSNVLHGWPAHRIAREVRVPRENGALALVGVTALRL